MRATALRITGLWAVCTAACSLLGLDQVALPTCPTACDSLNERAGIAPDACMRYQCVTETGPAPVCRLAPRDGDGDGHAARACGGDDCDDARRADHAGAAEVCDGRDNDCDGVVDEGVVSPALSELARDARLGEPARVSWTHAAGTTVAYGYALQASGATPRAIEVRLDANGATLSSPLSYASESDWASGRFDEPCSAGGSCAFGDLAAERIAGGMVALAVGVNRSGCSEGQLRLGLIDLAASPVFQQHAAPSRSNCPAGIDDADTGTGRRCTGARRPAGAPLGAAAPSLAWLEAGASGSFQQALAVWLGDRVERAACGGTAVDVEALALWSEETNDGTGVVRSVNASNAAVPVALGRTTGGGRPALAAWRATGFFVAHGDDVGGVALRFVPALANPPAFVRPTTTMPDPPPRTTPVLVATNGPALAQLRGDDDSPPDHVAVALGAETSGGVDLAVAWDHGCARGRPGVWFAVVRYAPGASTPFTVRVPPARLSALDEAGRAPALVYTARGLLAPNGPLADRVTDATDGGWIVAYVAAGDRVFARRVPELDGRAIDEAPIALDVGHPVLPVDPVVFTLERDRAVASAAYLDARGPGLVYGRVSCVANE